MGREMVGKGRHRVGVWRKEEKEGGIDGDGDGEGGGVRGALRKRRGVGRS